MTKVRLRFVWPRRPIFLGDSNMKRYGCAGLAVLLLAMMLSYGCFQAPERIDVQIGSPRPEPVNTAKVPPTYDQAVAELRKAHREIDYLRNKVRKLEDDKKELKEEKQEYKDKYKKLKDKYD